jgi:hypothetical protein
MGGQTEEQIEGVGSWWDRHAPGLSKLATQALLHPTRFPVGSSGPTSC